jgi:hypothetical protein
MLTNNKKILLISKNKTRKIKDWIQIKIFNLARQYIYVICLLNLFIKNIYLLNQMIFKTSTHIKLIK